MASLHLQTMLLPGAPAAAHRRPRPEHPQPHHLERRQRRHQPSAAANAANAAAAAPRPRPRPRPLAPARAAAPTSSAPPRGADLAALFAAEHPAGGPQTPQELRARFGVEGYVEFYRGEGGLPVCFLHHPSGHSVEVYLQGASVTRWLDAGRRDLLMPRPDAVYRRGAAINSGVPLSFPQWREGPLLPEGGFSSRLEWEVVEANVAFGVPRSGMSRRELEVESARRAARAKAEGKALNDYDIPGTTRGAAAAAGGGGEDENENEGGAKESGMPADVEPYVVLRLRDGAATRAAGYPHAFELLYRVSLSYSDDPVDLTPGAQQALAGATAERRLLAAAAADGLDLEADVAAADRALREGDEPPFEAGSPRAEAVRLLRAARAARRAGRGLAADPRGGDAPLPPRRKPAAASSAAADLEDDDDDDNDDQPRPDEGAPAVVAAAAKAAASATGATAASLLGMEVNRAALMPDAAAERDPPVQLKLSLYARNNADGRSSGASARAAGTSALKAALLAGKDEARAAEEADAARAEAEGREAEAAAAASRPSDAHGGPMSFEVALLPHFATLDQASPQGRAFVRARGLGGLRALDWSASAGSASSPPASSPLSQDAAMQGPRLTVVADDYVRYGQQAVDMAASAAHESDVRLCPGDRSHYRILQRGGLRDAIARHPGPNPPLASRRGHYHRHCAALGAGRVVAPVRLAPGEAWRGELVVRREGRYWPAAAWELAGEAAGAREPVPPLIIDPRAADR